MKAKQRLILDLLGGQVPGSQVCLVEQNDEYQFHVAHAADTQLHLVRFDRFEFEHLPASSLAALLVRAGVTEAVQHAPFDLDVLIRHGVASASRRQPGT